MSAIYYSIIEFGRVRDTFDQENEYKDQVDAAEYEPSHLDLHCARLRPNFMSFISEYGV